MNPNLDDNKEEALASLHQHSGWGHMQQYLDDKKQSLLKELENIDPEDSTAIANIQGQMKLINSVYDKPKRYFDKKYSGG